jgi:hypothetical protein
MSFQANPQLRHAAPVQQPMQHTLAHSFLGRRSYVLVPHEALHRADALVANDARSVRWQEISQTLPL